MAGSSSETPRARGSASWLSHSLRWRAARFADCVCRLPWPCPISTWSSASDDASDDATPDLLAAVGDARLRVERPRNREGLTRSLNRALGMARAPLVARLDADDMALPERFARQRAVFDAQPAIGLLGTGAQEVDASGFAVAVLRPPADDAGIRRALIRRNPFVHSSVMARRSIVEQAGGYDPRFPVAQDYDLWMRVSRLSRLGNVPEPLVIRRLIPGRISESREDDRLRAEARIRWRAVRR